MARKPPAPAKPSAQRARKPPPAKAPPKPAAKPTPPKPEWISPLKAAPAKAAPVIQQTPKPAAKRQQPTPKKVAQDPAQKKPAPKPAPQPAPTAADAKRPRGNQPYETNEKDRNLVRLLVAGGITYDRIAAAIDISERTLKRHYKRDIRVGQTEIDLLAVGALVRAMRGNGKEAVIAAKWWNQARMGWSEKITIDDPGANVPMRVEIELVGSADGAATPTHRDTGPRLPANVMANIDLKG